MRGLVCVVEAMSRVKINIYGTEAEIQLPPEEVYRFQRLFSNLQLVDTRKRIWSLKTPNFRRRQLLITLL